MAGDHLYRRDFFGSGPVLNIGRTGQVRDASGGQGRPAGQIDQHLRMLGAQDHVVVIRDVLEKCEDVDLLLEEGTDLIVIRMPGDREDRGVVELGVVEPVEEMDGTGTTGGEAHA